MIYNDLVVRPRKNVVVHDCPGKHSLWTRLRLAQPEIGATRAAVLAITNALTASFMRNLKYGRSRIAPVIVMRGGAFFLPSLWIHLSSKEIGYIQTSRNPSTGVVTVISACLPPNADFYVIFDLIVNSGDTLEVVAHWLADQKRPHQQKLIQVVAPFSTVQATERISTNFPHIEIHTLWNAIPLRGSGWLACLDFDAGDLAFFGGPRGRYRDPRTASKSTTAGSISAFRKVAALIRRGPRILAVTKKGKERQEVIMPGGKPQAGESQEQTLRRELREELGVQVDHIRWFGLFEGQSTFEGLPMDMDVYCVRMRGQPVPGREIARVHWITVAQNNVPLGNMIRTGVLPALHRQRLKHFGRP